MSDESENVAVSDMLGHNPTRISDAYLRTRDLPEGAGQSFGAQDYVIRAAALSSDDDLMRDVLLSLLNESKEQALAALKLSCWAEDLSADPAEQRELLRQSIASAIAPQTSAGTL